MPKKIIIALVAAALLLAGAGVMVLAITPLRESAAWHIQDLTVKIRYALFPPEEAVFVPVAEVDAMVQATMQALNQMSATPSPTFTATATLAPDQPTAAPTLTPTPPPPSFNLTGVRYMDQHGLFNYCAPANLAMGLSYWGWQGDRMDTGTVLKPFEEDKNVMMYEMADYVLTQTYLAAAVRPAGTQEILKRFIAAGYPVLVEKGPYIKDTAGKVSWMGHYALLTGYDDAKQHFLSQDSYFSPDYPITYEQLDKEWRSFNYLFLVIYPPDRESEVMSLLGSLADERAASQIAADRAAQEMSEFTGIDQFFATYNYGTSLVELEDYAGAAAAYDTAFQQMAAIPSSQRPWRMAWYQTGPYFAYYFTGRYQDVINLADNTLNNISQPYLEESFVWRARARIALGDTEAASQDVLKALEYHPGFTPAVGLAQQLGIAY